MSRNVRVKTVQSHLGDTSKDISETFSQLFGASNADPDILKPKIVTVLGHMFTLRNVYGVLLSDKFLEDFPATAEAAAEAKAYFAGFFSKRSLTTLAEAEKMVAAMDIEKSNAFFNELKGCPEYERLIISVGALTPFKVSLEDEKKLDGKFVKKTPGILQPIDFCPIDLKQIWETAGKSLREIILRVLSKTYTLGRAIYTTMTSPNVDVKTFSQKLCSAIAKCRKFIPRCDKAFDVIENSVGMLEEKFESYYRDSLDTDNQGLIMELFITDLAEKQRGDRTAFRQFFQIIKTLKKKQSSTNDPKIKKLFKSINKTTAMMNPDKMADRKKAEGSGASGSASKGSADDERLQPEDFEGLSDSDDDESETTPSTTSSTSSPAAASSASTTTPSPSSSSSASTSSSASAATTSPSSSSSASAAASSTQSTSQQKAASKTSTSASKTSTSAAKSSAPAPAQSAQAEPDLDVLMKGINSASDKAKTKTPPKTKK